MIAGLAALVAGAAGVAVIVKLTVADLPDVNALKNYRPPLTTTVFSRDGVLMAELAEENRYIVEPSALPAHVVWSFIASEDGKFYEHAGIDFQGILRAALNNLRHGRVVQGGSTITQQVAKALLLTPERSFRRKIREIALAFRIEENLSKEEIIKLYLNQIYLGHGAYGVEAAAKVYFGVKAEKLTISQAALLAGLPQAPSAYDPYRHPDEAQKRRSYVLEQMLSLGKISKAEYQKANAEPIVLANYENFFKRISPYFTEQARRELDSRYGSAEVLKGGMKVVTTMDSKLQMAAQRALQRGIEGFDHKRGYHGLVRVGSPKETAPFMKGFPEIDAVAEALVTSVTPEKISVLSRGARFDISAEDLAWAIGEGNLPSKRFRPGDVVQVKFRAQSKGTLAAFLHQEPSVEGALVCLDAHTGEVLAMVGGYSFDKSQFNRATQAKRQAGSAIKPFIYGAAIEKGLTPAYVVFDTPVVYDAPGLEEKWKPKNYSDKFYGATTLREALVLSRNLVTVKVLQDIGTTQAISFLRRAGITSDLGPDLSLALGACAVSPIELAAAYGVFATGGFSHTPAFIASVTDRDGNLLQSFKKPAETTPNIDPRVAFVINNMMQAVINEGTGARARGLPVPAAGKTGTTNEARDAWFVGVTPDLITAVWIGNDDNTTIGSGETGGAVSAPIWKEFMDRAVLGRKSGDFPMPEGIEFATVDGDTGMLAGPRSKRTFNAAFIAGTVPGKGKRVEIVTGPGETKPKSFDADDPSALDALR